ncbi:hypothetical protein [Granulicella arctica]|uniref:hypothetical protein n=1 Tax=Granulicella arctica TaxID=940613 RepID=UPI0021DFE57D|nr:hypothetical protein [Granulicella arctica]
MSRLGTCISTIARPALYTREQWIALILSLLCFAIDACAIYQSLAEMQLPDGLLRHRSPASPAMLMTEAALIVAGFGLLWFAFSRHPDRAERV